jgi:choline dehydrogenase-like flavoprotein
VSLASSDPRVPPLIDPNFLERSEDLRPLVRGLELARHILSAPEFDSCAATEIVPGPEVRNEQQLAEYVRQSASTVFHPVGTCRMGGDTDSVVDPQLRVREVQGLRVVDASIFPTIIGGNTNAAVVMVAEKAADLVLGRAPPTPSTSKESHE